MPRQRVSEDQPRKLDTLDIEGFNEYLRLVLPNYVAGSRVFGGAEYVEYWLSRDDLAGLNREYLGTYNPRYLSVVYRSWTSKGWVYELRNDAVRLYIPVIEAPTGLPAILRVETIERKTVIRLNRHLARSLGLRDNQRIRLIAYRLWDLDGPRELDAYVAYLVLKVRLVVNAPPGKYLVMSAVPP